MTISYSCVTTAEFLLLLAMLVTSICSIHSVVYSREDQDKFHSMQRIKQLENETQEYRVFSTS